jgi:hypothetical protein
MTSKKSYLVISWAFTFSMQKESNNSVKMERIKFFMELYF